MPGLYTAATHYWSMSHGEGWDQPMTEAAASGLRLIAPDHTAYRTYLDPSAGTLLPCRQEPASRLDVAEADPCIYRSYFTADPLWWEPDREASMPAVRGAIEGRDARRRLRASGCWIVPGRRRHGGSWITAHDRPSEQISKVGQTGRSRYGAGPKCFRLTAMPVIRASRMAVVISRAAVWTAVCFAKRQPASSER
jgi:hypothetical protein